MASALPYLTADLPGTGGTLKARPQDFMVEEVPAYGPSGSGTHVHMLVEKVGLTTHAAVESLARVFGRERGEVGYAGLKDARAVTRQTLSLEHIDLAQARALELPGLRVLAADLHTNKLRLGHLHGNRFRIRLRDLAPGAEARARPILERLERVGLPNSFGPQRFGARGDSWRIGRALLLEDFELAAALLAGTPGPMDTGRVLRARELYAAGEYANAAKAWPGNFREAIHLCRAMERFRGDARRALRTVHRHLLRLTVSAYQSWLFNLVLAQRLTALDRLMSGDLAWLHRNGAVFLVQDPHAEQGRVDAFELSPSGPLFGTRMSTPQGEPERIEQSVLAAEGVEGRALLRRGPLQWKGARRPLRVPVRELALAADNDEAGAYLELSFLLPPGSYATALAREVMKSDQAEALAE